MGLSSTTQPVFMLVSPFTFNPDTSPLKLGCLLGPKKGSKALPDPARPFSSTSNILPLPSGITPTSQTDRNFFVEVGESSGFGAHVEADTSILSGIGAKLGLEYSRNWRIVIDCRAETSEKQAGQADGNVKPIGEVETITFEPSTDYIKQAVENNDLVKDYLTKGRLRLRSRPVFIITGLMTVRGQARISIVEDHSRKFEAGASADLMAATGGIVPLNAGVNADANKGKDRNRNRTFEGPFVLAYRLRKINTTRQGKFTSEEDYNAFALMDDDKGQGQLVLEHEAVTLDILEEPVDESDSDLDSI